MQATPAHIRPGNWNMVHLGGVTRFYFTLEVRRGQTRQLLNTVDDRITSTVRRVLKSVGTEEEEGRVRPSGGSSPLADQLEGGGSSVGHAVTLVIML